LLFCDVFLNGVETLLCLVVILQNQSHVLVHRWGTALARQLSMSLMHYSFLLYIRMYMCEWPYPILEQTIPNTSRSFTNRSFQRSTSQIPIINIKLLLSTCYHSHRHGRLKPSCFGFQSPESDVAPAEHTSNSTNTTLKQRMVVSDVYVLHGHENE